MTKEELMKKRKALLGIAKRRYDRICRDRRDISEADYERHEIEQQLRTLGWKGMRR